MKTLLASVAALALIATPVLAADSAKPDAGKTTNSDPSAKQPSTGADGASSGTESSGNMQTKGVGEPKPDASGKNTNSDGSPGKNTNGPSTGPSQ
jgi:hypothetical protein